MIKSLRVQNFRRHRDFTVDFTDGISVIVGPNGSGKTSLIEAIYVALRGKSWRSNFQEILRDGADWWRVDVELRDGEKRTVRYENAARSFEISGKAFARLPVKYKKPVVLFEPSDLNLLYGSPARRRDYIDRFIAEIEPAHGTNLHKFERVLKQRNNLLKQSASRADLFVWNVQFADLAEKIIARRADWIEKLNQNLATEYIKIAGRDDGVTIKYRPAERSRKQIINKLAREHAERLPFTNSGPQKHDIEFKIRSYAAKTTASRGENRTIIQALKNLEYQQQADDLPLVMLDDILSELDDDHRNNLTKSINSSQVIITSVDDKNLSLAPIKLSL
jgi:DNA replication and repair protein RecF